MSIEVKNLNYVYNEGFPGETLALDNVNFRLEDGEIVGIIGHTGSGKSTLLQQLNGLLKPKSGTIVVGDTVITDSSTSMLDVRKRIGLVFQYPEYQLFEETVAKDVAYGPSNLGLEQEEIDRRVKDALELVGLDYEQVKNASPFELSGGQKRRVAIAGVIAMKPEVLILDEPTAGLNPKAHRDILDMVRAIHEEENNIIILVSHDMDDIAAMSDRVLVMNKGTVVMNGTPGQVFARRDELTAIGLEVPAASKLLGRLRDEGIEIDTDCLTISQAADRIVEVFGK
ncbi:MAG: energy-coupling factor transporter ATPase [Clostridiales bacterium]|nr:energy-coupling factor transporter ATPase [Clostridiales bacterium]MDD7015425.1 energy-coupling factor transporter ATPase [Bacillota bacterium]MDY4959818.1 energy-coupling factor transporter ATPase [Lentihominibacter sp.]